MEEWMVRLFKGHRLCRPVFVYILLCIGVLHGCASTKEEIPLASGVKAVIAAFPAGTIDSVKKVNDVQNAVNHENQVLDYQFGLDMNACIEKFLVNNCYEEVREQLRKNRAVLRQLSVEADRFKRSDKVRLRDEAIVNAEQRELDKAPEREASRRRYEEKEARYLQEQTGAGADESSPPRLEEGVYTVGTPSVPKNSDTALTPAKRAENIRNYEEKRLESERKQESVRSRMAATQEKRDRHAANAGKEVKRKQKEAKD